MEALEELKRQSESNVQLLEEYVDKAYTLWEAICDTDNAEDADGCLGICQVMVLHADAAKAQNASCDSYLELARAADGEAFNDYSQTIADAVRRVEEAKTAVEGLNPEIIVFAQKYQVAY